MSLAKQARYFAQPPRRPLQTSRTRARGVTRIAARVPDSHVLVAPRAADFHRVFAGIGGFRDCKRVAYVFVVPPFNGDAGDARFLVCVQTVNLGQRIGLGRILERVEVKFATMETKLVPSTTDVGEDTLHWPRKWNLARAHAGRMAAHRGSTRHWCASSRPLGGSIGRRTQFPMHTN